MSLAVPGLVNAASLQLSWIDNSQDEDGFHIERKLGTSGTFSLIATTGLDVTSYSDATLADNTTYCYRVNAFNSAGDSGYTNEACATTSNSPLAPPPPVSSTLTATLLGQTGEDIAGMTSETPDGINDVHIILSGVQGTITGVRITGANGIWETPFNGQNWIVAIRPQTNSSLVDLYFDFWQVGSSYTVALTFADGSTQTVQAAAQTANTVQLSQGSATTTALGNSTSSTTTQFALGVNAVTKIGVFRADTGEWFLDMNGNGGWDGCGVDKCFGPFGVDGDLPIVGDWNGTGQVAIGAFRPSTGEWFLDMNGNGGWDGCGVDKCFGPFGVDGDLPIVGDWNGTGQVAIGVFRPSTGEWFLDMNGNGRWDGYGVDRCFGPFGVAGDLPIVGD